MLVVRDEMLQKRPGQVLALLRSWEAAYRFYQANPQQGQAIIARGVGASADELDSAFAGVKFYSLADNQRDLQVQGEFINTSMRHITKPPAMPACCRNRYLLPNCSTRDSSKP